MGSALASSGSVLELAGIGSVGHGDLLTESTPVGPLLPKPCHANPIQSINHFSILDNHSNINANSQTYGALPPYLAYFFSQ